MRYLTSAAAALHARKWFKIQATLSVSAASVCAYCWLSTYVRVSVFILYSYIGSPLAQPSCARPSVCYVLQREGGGSLIPRAGLIGVKQASEKSHQRLGTLSETGNLLLGDFLQLHGSPCPCLSYCLSPYPSLLKSLIAAQFPSAPFLSPSLSVGFKHLLFITRTPTLGARPLVLFVCLMSALERLRELVSGGIR